MLDTDTKRRIDTCRDILVGKVPDPKSQVEQITVALIYKFMDDMDLEAEELGGERRFFTKDYERYRWAKLVAPGVSGQDMLNTYSEALTKMVENDGLPKLFRDIFRNAYLPYRDPETLRSFLREINSFTYDHSEKLGDAFEYLLSVLGSQGDAGQFRTPRHIIDFMVEIIDPKKTETIMDPACGTAGFLISAYKHILKQNSTTAPSASTMSEGEDAAEQALESPLRYPGDKLSQEDRLRLANNIYGYDISPDMVRLSLVNLYLHGFADPKIEEYDTLTSEDKWQEMADVILANPPFMSPKGGIKPHTRFQVQSKRSEVLFVDYIAEHLSPQGRAAIVVPEGIIFQSQSAYVALRKMLVENHLAAVISLPAGVFNPYSGVKTSILILDRAVAKASKQVAFFKIENDGFALGAQRKGVKGSNLPQVKADLSAWLQDARAGGGVELHSPLGEAVARTKLAEDGDFNLSVERYKEKIAVKRAWPMVPLGDVTKRLSGGTPSKANSAFWEGDIPWVSPKDMKSDVIFDTIDHVSRDAVAESATSLVQRDTILCVVRSGILQHSFPVALAAREMCFNQDLVALVPESDLLLPHFLFWNLKCRSKEILAEGIKPGVTVQSFHSGYFKNFLMPLPPLEAQREIVAEIKGYQRVIDGARAVLENYRPHIPVDPEWPVMELGEICTPEYGFTASAEAEGQARFIRITDISADGMLRPDDPKFVDLTTDAEKSLLTQGDLLVARTGATFGKTMMFVEEYPAVFASYLIRLRFPPNLVAPKFYWAFAQSSEYWSQANSLMTGGGQPQFNGGALKKIKFSVPPLDVQQAIVAEIETEQALVNGNRDLISRFEKKIAAAIARVWGEAKEAAE
ncbi:type I restriction enzyme M protein [Roseovarius lutimaris]|uniref:site-specific DNA-methyltransferase (adenine-specific) n=1 Tax=Roseovarius lutimaris TaxID=1005928 RepID=A0A1I5GQV0_9RHOB|nr:N-6 DNA methylase [Roseovarius lutimaris]SFO38368.1 type I restriction enzyme M protein [Roseovarius lutimaris]